MEKEFVPYELAVKLKELGFNEPCFAFFQVEYTELLPIMVDDDEEYRVTGYRTCSNLEMPKHYTSAPTYSQAFRWFREKYGLGHMINGIGYESFIMNIGGVLHIFNAFEFETYEEAELACLDKLIEIVESKSE